MDLNGGTRYCYEKGKIENDTSLSIQDLLFELGRNEEYVRDELNHLIELGYIEIDEREIYLSGNAKYLLQFADMIIEEINDAEEDGEMAIKNYDELIR